MRVVSEHGGLLTNSLPLWNLESPDGENGVGLVCGGIPLVWQRIEAQLPSPYARGITTSPGPLFLGDELEGFHRRNSVQRHGEKGWSRKAVEEGRKGNSYDGPEWLSAALEGRV